MILCVYALVSAPPARLNLPGVGGERLKVITVDRIGVVVGELRRAPAPSVRNLRRYAAAVDAIAARTSAILPARYGTAVVDADELTLVIRSRRAALRDRLAAVRGRAQMTIRFVGSDPVNESCGGQTPSTTRINVASGATQGTQYLRQKVADAAASRAVPAFDPVRRAIRSYVKDERVEKRGRVVTINHLVPRGSVERYRDLAERAADEHALRLVVTGPWPPYAFADTW